MIQVKRSLYNAETNTFHKDSSSIEVDKVLHVSKYATQGISADNMENSGTTYDLESFIVHHGEMDTTGETLA